MSDQDLTHNHDDAALRVLLDEMRDAWDRGDGSGYAACFTVDASYVTFVGTVYRGRDEIGRAHQALFDSLLKGTRLVSEIRERRFVNPDLAIVITRGATGKRTPTRLDKVQTYTAVRMSEDRWLIAAFQNTKRKTLMERLSFLLKPDSKPTDLRRA